MVIPFESLVPLQEIIAECFQRGKGTKTVQTVYEEMLNKQNEFEILLNLNRKQLEGISSELIAEAIMRVRSGNIVVCPGYDGEYGTVKVFTEDEVKLLIPKQNKLV